MPKTLLVVDDSANIREAARLALTGEEWNVELAATADEALESLRNQKPDAVLCDVAIGEEDGYDLVKKIRRASSTANLPVILMGGTVSPAASMASGASATLPKPFSADELLDTLRVAIDTVSFDLDLTDQPAEGDADLTLDEAGEVSSAGEEEVEIIDLSGDEEYAELELLEGLEPIEAEPEASFLSRSNTAWAASDSRSGSVFGGQFDLNLDELLTEPKTAEGQVSAALDLEEPVAASAGGAEDTDLTFELDVAEVAEPIRVPSQPPHHGPELAGETTADERKEGWPDDTDLTLQPMAPPEADQGQGFTGFRSFGPIEEEWTGDDGFETDRAPAQGPHEPSLEFETDGLSSRVSAAAEQAVRDALSRALTPERLVPAVEAVVERVIWEVVPPLAERLLQEAIEKIRREPPPA